MEPESNEERRLTESQIRSKDKLHTFGTRSIKTRNRGVQTIMKKLILTVFMLALIAGASFNSTANAPLAETPGIVATPNLIYCLYNSSAALAAGGVLGGIAGGAAAGWLVTSGYGLLACVGGATGIGAVFLGAGV